MAQGVAVGGHRRGVAGEVEIERAVGQVALGTGKPRGGAELALPDPVSERRPEYPAGEQEVQKVIWIRIVGYPSAVCQAKGAPGVPSSDQYRSAPNVWI
jgi:hypothetical protein